MLSHMRSQGAVAVDLFCGAGGLSYGMQQAGIAIAAGIDIDPACRHPFSANVQGSFHQKDVTTLTPGFVESLFTDSSIRVLAGCAPCQPFSSYTNKHIPREDEWQLLSKFGQLVSGIQPEIVTMENVPQVERRPVFQDFLAALDDSDYSYNYQVVQCTRYGVPQRRRRLVLLGSRLGSIDLIPPTYSESELPTAGATIRQLDEIRAGEVSASDPLHASSGLSERNLKRIQNSTPGGTWHDWEAELRAGCHTRPSGRTYPGVYGRMEWDKPAPTITTQFNAYGSGRFGHPEQDRGLSLREGALLQTFPGDYSFVPPGTPVRIAPLARLIGNAVPVKLGEAIGRSIVAHLEATL